MVVMPKPKAPSTPALSRPELRKPRPQGGRRSISLFLNVLGFLVLLGGLVYLVQVARQYDEREAPAPTGPLRIALVNKPVWMSDFLALQIADTIPKNSSSAFDHDLLVKAVAALKKNPWVSSVNQVRRVYGDQPGDTLEIDCDFRAPVALVKWGQYYWLIDNDGYLLPEQYTSAQLDKITIGRDGRTCLRVIDGVKQPPPDMGHKWVGGDLTAGLDLIKLLYGKLFVDEVTSVDVSNFAGRISRGDPQLVLLTRYGTQVWWGRPLNAKDFFVEVSPARKLEMLRAVVQKEGRIDANQAFLDVRYDNLLIPSTQPTQARTIDDPSH
jgi:hypothetical protein